MLKRFLKKRRRAESRYIGAETLWGLLVTAAAALLYATGAFRSLESSILDAAMRLRGDIPPPPEIAIIEINQESVDTINRWPIPRDVYARLIGILSRAGASAVGMNLLLGGESAPEADRELAEEIRKAGMVYLPCFLESIPRINQYIRLVRSMPMLTEAARAEGIINMPADPDGVLRHVLLGIPFENSRYWQLSFLMARDRLGIGAGDVRIVPPGNVEMRAPSGRAVRIPVDRSCAMIIDWNGPWEQSFRRYSLEDIFESDANAGKGLPARVPLENLRGRICLVGLTVPGAFDSIRTPFETTAPSIAAHANILSQILAGRFVAAVPKRRNMIAVVLLGIAASLAIPRLRPGTAILAVLGACALYAAFFLYLYLRHRVQITVLYPVATMLLAYLTMSIHHEISISIERARLLHLATRDGLTGLYVVGHMRLLLSAEIAESARLREPLSLVMADVDHFKEVNDAWGHQVGDFVLKETAKILQGSCRELDIVGRYGGEEFIMVLPDTPLPSAKGVAERIRSTVEGRVFSHQGRDYRVTISLGVAELGPFDAPDDLIKRADDALYAAKHGGRNRVCAAEPGAKAVKTISL